MKDWEKDIRKEVPLNASDFRKLQLYIQFGYPVFDWAPREERLFHPRITMAPFVPVFSFRTPFGAVSNLLLMQPAYELVQRLIHKCNPPRYICRCQAPSCGRRFFTYRKTQVTCPSKTKGKESKCKSEWTKYTRFLKKHKHFGKLGWDNLDAKLAFLNQ